MGRDQLRDDTFLNGSHEVSAQRGDLAQPQCRAAAAPYICVNMSRNRTKLRARLINEVPNGGNLDLIEDLYAPRVAAGVWITPFRKSFPDVHMNILQLIAERDRVVGHFTCTPTHTHPG